MENKEPTYSQRLSWGLSLMAVALLISTLLAINSLFNLNVQVDTQSLSNTQVNPMQIATSCLSPLSFILQVVGGLLIFADSKRLVKQIGSTHRTLTIIALISLVLSLVLTAGTIVMSFGVTMQGSLSALQTASWLGASAAILMFAFSLLLIFAISPAWGKAILVGGLVLYLLATISTTLITTSQMSLQPLQMSTGTLYIPQINFDRSTGAYPILTGLGALSPLLYVIVYAVMAIISWQSATKEVAQKVL